MAKKIKKAQKWLLIIFGLMFVGAMLFTAFTYMVFFIPNIYEDKVLYLEKGSTSTDLFEHVEEENIVKNTLSLKIASKIAGYDQKIIPGRYELNGIRSNFQLIKKLRKGRQDAVNFRFHNIRLKKDFAGKLGECFEADSLQFIQLLNDEKTADQYGFTSENFYTMFIPNTYNIYWNTSPKNIIKRFNIEYTKFWNEDRIAKAKKMDLTPQEVSILASIVQGEVIHSEEMSKVAGLYLNRLEKGLLLQADPTVVFAANDFTIRRVLKRHLLIESPYNTYLNKGLPPGPINMPSIAAIDAVLNHEKHDYIFMSAKEDLSGYHNFNVNLVDHQRDARKYQRELDKRNIK